MKILVADDSKLNLAILTSTIERMGHVVLPATSGEKAIEIYETNKPDLVILDVVMEGIDGFECARRIRLIDSNNWIPIIFLSSSADDASISKGIDAGGDDYLIKPVSEIKLAAKIKAMQRISDMRKKLSELNNALEVLSSTDTLTRLYNRLQFNKVIEEKMASANRRGHSFALLFLDIDRFKPVNDILGHQIGDLLLIAVAKRLTACIRVDDFLARIGGDEFAIILDQLPKTQDAGTTAAKIIDVMEKPFIIEEHLINIGISIGISIYPSMGKNLIELVKHADQALYKVKESGRGDYKFFTDI